MHLHLHAHRYVFICCQEESSHRHVSSLSHNAGLPEWVLIMHSLCTSVIGAILSVITADTTANVTTAAATTQRARATASASSTANSSPAHSRPATATSRTSANNNGHMHSSSMHTSNSSSMHTSNSSSSAVLAPNTTVTHSHSAHSSSHSTGEQARLALFAAANAELAAAGTAASYRDPQHRQRKIDLSTKPSAWIQQQPLQQQQQLQQQQLGQ
jgi:hypothetical protein